MLPELRRLHGEEYKHGMVEAGRWRITRPELRNHAGFRLSCLIAPHAPASWPRLATEFLTAKKRVET